MKLAIESTHRIVIYNGQAVRLWEGVSSKGTPVICYMAYIDVQRPQDVWQLEQELLGEHRIPSSATASVPSETLP